MPLVSIDNRRSTTSCIWRCEVHATKVILTVMIDYDLMISAFRVLVLLRGLVRRAVMVCGVVVVLIR